MRKITSEGQGWEITEDGREILLILKSPYGSVYFKAKHAEPLWVMQEILERYDKLKAHGPLIEENSKEFL